MFGFDTFATARLREVLGEAMTETMDLRPPVCTTDLERALTDLSRARAREHGTFVLVANIDATAIAILLEKGFDDVLALSLPNVELRARLLARFRHISRTLKIQRRHDVERLSVSGSNALVAFPALFRWLTPQEASPS